MSLRKSVLLLKPVWNICKYSSTSKTLHYFPKYNLLPKYSHRNKFEKCFSSKCKANCDCSSGKGGLDIFCEKCGSIRRPAANLNYFDIMGMNKTFDVNDAEVSNKYKELQKLLHPDKYGNKSDDEKKISEEYSSLVNKAYSTLLDPLKRGLYLLKLKNITISEQTQMRSDFLLEIMERNEAVAEADTPEKILKIDDENKIILTNLVKQLSSAFQRNDDEEVLNLVVKLKYFTSIDNQIKEIIRKMGIIK